MDKVEILPDDAIISIEFSGSFYKRLQESFLMLSQITGDAQFLVHYKKIIDSQPLTEPVEHVMYTLLVIINEIEKTAKEQNKTKVVEVNKS